MTKAFQPMLAATLDPSAVGELGYPRFVSPKLDGIRAVVRNGVVLSRKLKPIPSLLIQERYGRPEFEGLDGELMTGPPNAEDVFRRTTSAVMTINADPAEVALTDFQIFDCVLNEPYAHRVLALHTAESMYRNRGIVMVPQELVTGPDRLEELEEFFVTNKFEGAMLRTPDSPYKFGRSTLREGYLLKLKRFAMDEYRVTGFEEKMRNDNALEKDERGYAKRSTHSENLVPTDTLGAWVGVVLTGPYEGKTIKVAPTGSHSEQAAVWLYRQRHIGQVRRFKYFPSGSKDLPRFPIDQGPRLD